MPDTVPERSYGCSWGCGNPYDYVFIDVASGTTEFLCLPCQIQLCQNIITALIDPSDGIVQAAVSEMGTLDTAPVNGSKPKARGKNAPVGTDDDDLLEAFSTIVTVEELPEEFR